MIKRIIPIAFLGIALSSIIACNSTKKNEFQAKDGFEYKIVKDVPGDKKPAIGDIVEINFEMLVGDSVIANSRQLNNHQPVQMQLSAPQFRGDWTSGMTMLTVGDSAIFRIAADTIKKGTGQMPPYIKSGQSIEFRVSVVSIKSKDDFKKEMDEKASKQKAEDDKILQDYFTRNNLKPTKTASGLYYTIEKDGKGDSPKPGQQVTVKYTGTLINGEKFDSNEDTSFHHVQPFTFPLGQGQVIPGWDEGIGLLKKGSKATLFVPSTLAYGPQARSEKIGANAILIFKVELVDFK